MSEAARYACDKCRSRKIACSREQPTCERCRVEGVECTYSRSGVIHRNRKRKRHTAETSMYATPLSTISDDHATPTATLEAHLAPDIEATRGLLQSLDTSPHNSLGALSSLSEACAAVWHDVSELDNIGKGFFLFEARAEAWADAFTSTLKKGHPLMINAPDEVVDNLRGSRPHLVRERAWLVMYYGIVLTTISSATPGDASTKAKIKCNLWLALNDVRILLEPSEPNIQALTLLASHVEEFTTPSFCWLLTTIACRMLQALGVSMRNLSPETRLRRKMVFWHLNILDKGLAMIFGRPPTFHRAMAREVGLPTVAELLQYEPHVNTPPQAMVGGRPGSLFGAHFLHQVMQLAQIMGDIWYYLYDDMSSDQNIIDAAKVQLDAWYLNARTLLQAAATAEKPLLDARGAASLDLGLVTLNSNHHYLIIMLTRRSPKMREQRIESSIKMLHLLEHLVSDSEEVYNGIVWQLVCCPFTAFLTLFGDIVSHDEGHQRAISGNDEGKYALEAMQRLPVFLAKMAMHNSLARKLEGVAVTLVAHATALIQRASEMAKPVTEDLFDWKSFFGPAAGVPMTMENTSAPESDARSDDWTDHTAQVVGGAPAEMDQFGVDWLTFTDTCGDWNQL